MTKVFEGVPIPFFEASGWGALGIFVIASGWFVYRWLSKGTIVTKGEHDRTVQGYKDRIQEIIASYEGRLSDKDAVIADKDKTNRENVETMKTVLDTLDAYGEHLANIDRQNAVTEQVVTAIQQVTSKGGGPS